MFVYKRAAMRALSFGTVLHTTNVNLNMETDDGPFRRFIALYYLVTQTGPGEEGMCDAVRIYGTKAGRAVATAMSCRCAVR